MWPVMEKIFAPFSDNVVKLLQRNARKEIQALALDASDM